MLRRQPTAITLTNEDILKYEEDRRRETAEQNTENRLYVTNNGTKPAAQEKPQQKTAGDRIMGSGNTN